MNDEFLELIRLLKFHDVEFLVVGAYALAVYLEPRATQDLELWLKCTNENLKRFGDAMSEFGISVSKDSQQDFARGRKLIRIGMPPSQVDFLSFLGPTGMEFDFNDVFNRSQTSEIYGEEIFVPSAQDMLLSKIAANRPKDQGDIALLKELLND
jgi:hypothetical protein